MRKVYMTKNGYQQLQEELKRLKTVERPRLAKVIAEARALGDLSENAEYKSAKEEQSFLETRIAEIETKLAYAEVVDTSKMSGDRILFGASVKLLDLDTDEVVEYRIVGTDEADIRNGTISCESPIAKALIGREVGEVVEVRVPKGIREFDILEVNYS